MFRLKQYLKMILQNILLPVIYGFYRRRPIRKGSVLFADAHHQEMPFSMKRMYEAVKEKEDQGRCSVTLFVQDTGKMAFGKMVSYLFSFMKQYATAEYVFICDYFLPVAACKKREETTVVQLWHSCGLMKKIAYDTGQDIPKNYRGNMFGNYSLLTLSAKICVPVHARALKIPADRIRDTGVSRTDCYFDTSWNERCRNGFYEKYPQAKGKKILLWAPTFRGNAAMPRLEGLEEVKAAAKRLGPDWYLIIKTHPHVDAHGMVSNCSIPSEELLPVADVLITDYSSILFDYLIYRKASVLFAPDLRQYEENRGFYLDYRSIPFPVAETGEELTESLKSAEQWQRKHREEIEQFAQKYTGACDGRATGRILKLIGLGD